MTQEKLENAFEKFAETQPQVSGFYIGMPYAREAWNVALKKAAEIAESHPLWTGEYIAAEIRKLMD